MGKYSEKAVENFKLGYNCAQSVFLAFSSDFGIEEAQALKLSSSFGGGMGRLREVCGAVSSMFAIAGLKYGYISPNDDELKAKHYELIQKLAEKFKEKYGTIICRELLDLPEGSDSPIPAKRTEEYYATRPCEAFVRYACEIIEELIEDKLDKTVHLVDEKAFSAKRSPFYSIETFAEYIEELLKEA